MAVLVHGCETTSLLQTANTAGRTGFLAVVGEVAWVIFLALGLPAHAGDGDDAVRVH
jgi:hypothetical protein